VGGRKKKPLRYRGLSDVGIERLRSVLTLLFGRRGGNVRGWFDWFGH
jgi:hypothetical protein